MKKHSDSNTNIEINYDPAKAYADLYDYVRSMSDLKALVEFYFSVAESSARIGTDIKAAILTKLANADQAVLKISGLLDWFRENSMSGEAKWKL